MRQCLVCNYLDLIFYCIIIDDESEEPLTPESLKMYRARLHDLERILKYPFHPAEEPQMFSYLADMSLTHVNVSTHINRISVSRVISCRYKR